MWDKEGKKYCWNCSAILPYKWIVTGRVDGKGSYQTEACTKCGEELKPPEEKTDASST